MYLSGGACVICIITSVLAYSSLIWILSLSKGRPDDNIETTTVLTAGDASQVRSAFTGFEMIALAFRGNNLVLEIQGTLPSNRKSPSRKPLYMWKGVVISYLLIAMCIYPLAIAGYWAHGDKETPAPLEMQVNTVTSTSVDGGGEFSGEHNPHDAWLPITESRNGSIVSATLHLLCSGIGNQMLSLPLAFVSLGWFWGILCLSLLFSWQFYTIWLLLNLHESAPVTGIRYSRFMHLSIVAFGEKLGKLLALFPTIYLSGGACVIYIITGGATMERFFLSMCDDNLECRGKTLTGAEWFLLFICIAILIALFFPNLNSLASVSFIGSITVLAYSSLIWIFSLSKGRPHDHIETTVVLTGGDTSQIRKAFIGFDMIALAFRGHNLVLEIQGTLPSNTKNPSRKPTWRGVVISYSLIAMCIYPLAIAGYWVYGDKISENGGIIGAFIMYHQNSISKHIIRAIYLLIIINYLCAFQIYVMPTLDNFGRLYVAKKNGACPRWVRSAIKLFFGGLTYLIAVAFPFLPSLGTLIGAIALPLTFVYPCFMWIAIKKPQRFSTTWCLNMGIGSSGVVLSVMLFAIALWSLIVDGLEANFFKPK